VVSMGRYGRTKKMKLEVPRTLIKDVFGSDDRLGCLVDYAQKFLSKKEHKRR
jgi:hypothetical protein